MIPRSRSMVVAGATLLLLLLTTAVAVVAQRPQPAGTSGFFAHVEQTPGGQRLVATNPAVCGALPCPGSVFPLFSVGAPFPMNSVVTTINSRRFQTPTNPRIAMLSGPGSGVGVGPVLAVPTTTMAGATINFLEIFDFGSAAGAIRQVPVTLPGGAASMTRYQVLAAAGQFFVAETNPAGMNILRISFAPGGFWVISGAVVIPYAPSPFVSRMVYNAGNLVVAGAGGVSIINTTLPVLAMPVVNLPIDAMYTVGTEIATGLVNPGGTDMLVGLRLAGPGAGHSYLAFSSVGPAVPVMGPADPFGVGLSLAPGFHEIAVRADGAVATLPVAPMGMAAGAVGQLTAGGPALVATATAVPLTPFGNPESSRNGSGDPVLIFARDLIGMDHLLAVGAGVVNPLGALSMAPLAGTVNVTTHDRPMSLPFSPCVTAISGVVSTAEVFTVGVGPVVLAPTAFPVAGGVTSMSTVLFGAGAVPVGVGVHGMVGGNQATVCAPTPPVSLTCGGSGFAAPIAMPAGLTFAPPAVGLVPLFGARQPQTNVPLAPGVAAEVAVPGSLVIPGTAPPVPASVLDFCVAGAPGPGGAGGINYTAAGGLIVTEVLSL